MNADLSPLRPAPHQEFPGFEVVPQAWGTDLRRPARKIAAGGLLLLDAVAVVAVLRLGDLFAGGAGVEAALTPMILLAALVQILLKASAGLYPGYGLHAHETLRRTARAWAGGALVSASAGWLMLQVGIGPLAAMLLAFLLVLMVQLCLGFVGRTGLERLGLWGVPVRLLGAPERVAALERFLSDHPRYGFVPARRAEEPQLVLWVDDGLPPPETIERLRQRHAEVLLVSDLPKLSLSGVKPADHDGTLGLRITRPVDDAPGRALKRAFDLAVALPASLAVAPVMLLAALAIFLIDPGRPFYVQPREGRGGRKIPMLKLRTMYCDADRLLQELLDKDPAVRAEWETSFKLRKDPRILPVVGRLLRASSLDELPQLINIIRGDMSVVGPRPFPDYHLAAMPADFRLRRAGVVPGLTGLWQISGRSDSDVALQQQLDGYYLDNRSFWFDLSIVLGTFKAVLRGRGAY